ncbi:hypothetical protein B296_00032476 [Ensete ventricosum]|uniref:Uncharacterized protein n=1 Tax=Ensete ventricosum TaxID=4639 RepID=A0A427ADK4_ENSVE|nr:hypothetical protein B296_00032476 [Ensete ventricosum]
MVNRARWGKPNLYGKQLQVGCKCKLSRKLLEPLMRSATANKMSEKLDILRKRRGWSLECQPRKEATMPKTNLDVFKASLDELYQDQRRILEVESSQEEAESRIDKVESLVDRLIEDTKDSVQHLHEVMAELIYVQGGVAHKDS